MLRKVKEILTKIFFSFLLKKHYKKFLLKKLKKFEWSPSSKSVPKMSFVQKCPMECPMRCPLSKSVLWSVPRSKVSPEYRTPILQEKTSLSRVWFTKTLYLKNMEFSLSVCHKIFMVPKNPIPSVWKGDVRRESTVARILGTNRYCKSKWYNSKI